VYSVFVKDLEFYAYHGVTAEERKVGHRYRVSVSLEVLGTADESDNVEETVDYGAISESVLHMATTNQYATVEKLGRVIAKALLDQFLIVSACTVEVAKIAPPMPVVAAEAGVVISQTRAMG
jgi:dihydroneopterin aldolase